MSTIDVSIRQSRHTIVESGSVKYQVVTRILYVQDSNSAANNPDNIPSGGMGDVYSAPPLFLLKKITSDASAYLYDDDKVSYIRFASPEDFRAYSPFDPTNGDNTAWYAYGALPGMAINNETTTYAGTPDSDEKGYEDSQITSAAVTSSGYFVSGVLVRRFDNLKDADDHAEDIQTAVSNFKTNYNLIMDDFTTMNDTTTYPDGWATYSYS